MFGTVDITICALDSINHLDNIDDVRSVFSRVSLFAEPDGLFIFDINTVYKHRNILADNTFTYETDDLYCVWENTYNPQNNEIKINLEFFERQENGLYERSTESFSEKAYDCELIESLLSECGFEILEKLGDDTFTPPIDTTQRIVYCARKINQEVK